MNTSIRPSASSTASMNELLDRVRPGQLLVLRSTVFPGMTDRLARQLEQLGRADVDLAYCPERIVQGKSLRELEQLPQLVGRHHAAGGASGRPRCSG